MKRRWPKDNQVIFNGGVTTYKGNEIEYDRNKWRLNKKIVGKNGSISDLTRALGFRERTDQIGCFLQKVGYQFETPFKNINDEQYEHQLLEQIEKDIFSQNIENDYFLDKNYYEGAICKKYISYYERNPILRMAAIKYHGTSCKVCNFDFLKTYGRLGENYIEVHHLVPLHTLKLETIIDYKKDMTVVCSNCHRMIHRDQNNILTIDEIRNIIEKMKTTKKSLKVIPT